MSLMNGKRYPRCGTPEGIYVIPITELTAWKISVRIALGQYTSRFGTLLFLRNMSRIISFPSPDGAPSLHRAGVDLSGLMSVLGKHLYSTPMVAIRELVQNAHDSITRRRLEDPGWEGDGRITLIADRRTRSIRIIDTGAGLTEHEIHAYLATVGVGYTRSLRTGDDDTGLIGMFGLGFLSAFVLARRVNVRTTSCQAVELGHHYFSTNAEQYSVSPIAARAVGTEVELELHPEFEQLANASVLRDVLGRYCALLREPIYIGDDAEPVNPALPPWRREDGVTLHPTQQRRAKLEFATRFERDFEPIATMDLTADDDSDAVGLLWVQDGATYGTSDNRNLSVFLRGMLLDDDARDLLPPWAGFIGGVIESGRLTPTASREDLQRDEHYHATRHAISEALIQGLGEIAQKQPEAWRRILARHNDALLGASLCDERLFELLMNHLHIHSSQGDLAPRALVHKGAVHVMLERDNDFESMLFQSTGVPVACGFYYAVLPFLRRWVAGNGIRLIELGTEHGNSQLFTPATLAQEDVDWLARHLADGERPIMARFAPVELPLIVVPDRDALLKQRLEEDATDKRLSFAALSLARQFTAKISASHITRLYINVDNPAVQALLQARHHGAANIEAAARLIKAFKIISNARQQADGGEKLTIALSDLTRVAASLLETV
ncbi:molecular chaperone HtpG [Betaproteobacteria bacterium]|nr:molecular chaperone HtpG [Betaproteobacteria bacterium]GHT98726.1 molecular chaperone HtpG [Betaproteobacteria bacterium]GHU18600.1 molecular chaperone HtpG [Betaproteobacteria bacterium]